MGHAGVVCIPGTLMMCWNGLVVTSRSPLGNWLEWMGAFAGEHLVSCQEPSSFSSGLS